MSSSPSDNSTVSAFLSTLSLKECSHLTPDLGMVPIHNTFPIDSTHATLLQNYPLLSPCLDDLKHQFEWHQMELGITTGNPGVFPGNPYPYLSKPTPVTMGRGFMNEYKYDHVIYTKNVNKSAWPCKQVQMVCAHSVLLKWHTFFSSSLIFSLFSVDFLF